MLCTFATYNINILDSFKVSLDSEPLKFQAKSENFLETTLQHLLYKEGIGCMCWVILRKCFADVGDDARKSAMTPNVLSSTNFTSLYMYMWGSVYKDMWGLLLWHDAWLLKDVCTSTVSREKISTEECLHEFVLFLSIMDSVSNSINLSLAHNHGEGQPLRSGRICL